MKYGNWIVEVYDENNNDPQTFYFDHENDAEKFWQEQSYAVMYKNKKILLFEEGANHEVL